MPGRRELIATNEIYHVFNKGIDSRPTFTDKREYSRTLKVIQFYRFDSPPVRLSRFLNISDEEKDKILKSLVKGEKLVDIICFCLMPNHFHFLLKQREDNGISRFVSNFLNSYTRYFNTKHKRVGPLFLNQFKAVRIENDQQLTHVSRYIHLNPYTSFLVKDYDELRQFPWSSFIDYLELGSSEFVEKNLIMDFFGKTTNYEKFVTDQGDYQRRLASIKHLTLE